MAPHVHMESAHKKEFAVPILVVANKTDISAPVEGAGMSTLTGEGVEAVLERLFKMVTDVAAVQI